MTLIYRTEYRLGRRGASVTRTYGGARAFVAIWADLTLTLIFGAFGLVFGVIGWTLWLAYHLGRLVVLALRDVVSTLARFVRDVIILPRRLTHMNTRSPASKPAWASFDEL